MTMKRFEAGTVKIWCGNTYRLTIWLEWGFFYAILGHRKFQVSFSPATGIWHEVK